MCLANEIYKSKVIKLCDDNEQKYFALTQYMLGKMEKLTGHIVLDEIMNRESSIEDSWMV